MQPRFELNEDVAEAVEAIVSRVDGIPLAIELAAARVRVLSAREIADGLDDHLRLLRGGHQPDPRHQTIRASLDWSHALLTGGERRLFARLSVFSGGFDLEAAAAVSAGGAIDPGHILDEIEGLVDKSLLVVERRAGATRFRMLDFVRQYAAERRPEIAAELSVSVNTVSTHIRSIYAKLGTDDRSAAVRCARELRLLASPRR